jgi:two-component system, OmpR family, response regulator
MINKILLVDDEPDMLKLAQFSLEKIGKWNVVTATSGDNAILSAQTEKPDLIIMDFNMPEKDGGQTLAELRKNESTAGIPVIFLSARSGKKDAAELISLGAAGVIAKPFNPIELPNKIKLIMSKLDK